MTDRLEAARPNPFIFCGNEEAHEPHEETRGGRVYWCPGVDASAEVSVLAWWAQNYWRQIARLHQAYLALGIKDPVNYSGEVRNFQADSLAAALRATEKERDKVKVRLQVAEENVKIYRREIAEQNTQINELRDHRSNDAWDRLWERAEKAEARLQAAKETLRHIAGHSVRAMDDPCDWHCTRALTDSAHRGLEAVEGESIEEGRG